MSDLLKRPGRVKVTREIIESNPDEVKDILGAILIVDAQMKFITNTVEYMGYSQFFDEQEDTNVIPEYKIDVDVDENGEMSVDFQKVE